MVYPTFNFAQLKARQELEWRSCLGVHSPSSSQFDFDFHFPQLGISFSFVIIDELRFDFRLFQVY